VLLYSVLLWGLTFVLVGWLIKKIKLKRKK
jgi:hypothetical protein